MTFNNFLAGAMSNKTGHTYIIDGLKCKRCGYEWKPRIDTKPKSCPACKNRKWDEDRENNI